MQNALLQRLQTYITAELGDAALYRELADMAPKEMDRQLIIGFAEDEQAHATDFQQIYKALTGRTFAPHLEPIKLEGSYYDILRDRVLDESGDYGKYGEQYLQITQNNALRNAYYRARTDENVHALRLLYLLSE